MNTYTRRLSQFVANGNVEIPDLVIKQAKRCIQDTMACMVSGHALPPGRLVADMFSRMGGRKEATVFATRGKLPSLSAAYVNASLACVLDYDDFAARGHPGATVIPAAFAAAETADASGNDLLRAVVIGYEVHARISRAIRPSPGRYRQVWGHATYQTLAAAATAASVFRLTADETAMALGLAGANAPVPSLTKFIGTPNSGTLERPASWLKNNYGWATQGGVLGALLAREGFTGNRRILDDPGGFWLMAGSDRCDFDQYVKALGDDWEILSVSFKPYPACRLLHAVIDSLGVIVDSEHIDPEDVHSIHVRSHHRLGDFMDRRPGSFVDAQFSLPFVAAMVLLRIPAGFEWHAEAQLSNPQVHRIADLVMYEIDPEMEAAFFERDEYQGRVTVHLKDGRVLTHAVTEASGSPSHPLSDEILKQKFFDLSQPIIGEQRTKELREFVWRLDEVGSVRDAMDAYVSADSGTAIMVG